MERKSRIERPLTIAGMVLSQLGLFVLLTLLVVGFYSASWELVIGWPARVCWIAWTMGGILLVFAGGKTWLSGIAQAAGGILGVVAAIAFEKPQAATYAMEIAAAALCAGSYTANVAYLLPEKARVPCNVANVVFILVCITALINVISFKTYRRLDWTATKFYDLSETTGKTLRGLDRDLRITVFMRPRVYEGRMLVPNPIHGYTRELLQRLKNMNTARISVEWLDPDWDRKRAEALLAKYNVSAMEVKRTFGVVVLEYGDGLHKYITSQDLADFELIRDPARPGPALKRLRAYTGEAGIMSALKGLMRGEKTTVYFLADHGEKDITQPDPRKGGLPTLKKLLGRENFEVNKLENLTVSGVPADCDVLVVAGPRRPIDRKEMRVIETAFRKGTNLLLLLDPLAVKGANNFAPSGLERFLDEYGIKLHRDIVTLWVRLGGVPVRVNPVPTSAKGCSHRIVDELRDKRIGFMLDSPRSMEIADQSSRKAGFQPSALVRTSSKFWGETDLKSYRGGVERKGDEDHTGPLVVAAALHEGPPPTHPAAAENVKPRLVVFGDSDFVAEGRLGTGGNLDLFMNSLYWLTTAADKQEAIGIAPKEPERVKFDISRDKLSGIVWTIVLGLPAIVLLFGAGVWWFRRK